MKTEKTIDMRNMKMNITITQSQAFAKYPYAVAADGDYVVTLCETKRVQKLVLRSWQEVNGDAYEIDSEHYLAPCYGLNNVLKYKDQYGNDIYIT